MANSNGGRKVRLVLIGLIVLLALIVTIQNTNVVVFRFVFWQMSISLVLLIPLVLLAGFAAGLLAYWLMARKERGRVSGR